MLLPLQVFAASLAIGCPGGLVHPRSASHWVHGRLLRTVAVPMRGLARLHADATSHVHMGAALDAGSDVGGGCDGLCHLVALATLPAPLHMLGVPHPRPQDATLLITSRPFPVADKPPRS